MEAVQRYGWKDVKSIANHVGTRTPTQARAESTSPEHRTPDEEMEVSPPEGWRAAFRLPYLNSEHCQKLTGPPLQYPTTPPIPADLAWDNRVGC